MSSSAQPYARPRVPPVVVAARLGAPSRWRWLIKWLLALPHYIVLVGLWIAVIPSAVVAAVMLLAGRAYPRRCFAFNLGVLRWSWRVSYYAYGVGGTDRYPPFSLGPEPGYAATLDVTFPLDQRRGASLALAWLAGAPQYLVAAILMGAGGFALWPVPWLTVDSIGLIGVLALTALLVLAVRGEYPRSLYELLVGLNRWVLRVAAYALLLTSAYPPFRLDPGETEPRPAR